MCIFLLGVSQAFLSQPLVLTRDNRANALARVRASLVAASALGSTFALGLAAVAAFLPAMRAELLVTAACLPLLFIGDSFRFGCAVVDRMAVAASVDALWLAILIGAGTVMSRAAGPWAATDLMLVWGGSGGIAGAAALWAGLGFTRPGSVSLKQFAARGYLGYRFSLEFLLVRGGNQLMALSLGLFVSVQAVGAIRAVSTLYGPFNVLVQAAALFGAPLVIGLAHVRRTRLLILLGGGLALVAVGVTLVLLIIPDRVGEALLGDTWGQTQGLIVPLGLQAVGVGFLVAAMLGVRVVEPLLSLRIQVASSLCFLVFFGAGVSIAGVQGAAWGFGLGTIAQASIATGGYVWAARRQTFQDRGHV